MHAFEAAATARFKDGLVEEIREHMPDHYHALGEQGVREAVELGIRNASAHLIASEAGVTLFVRFMMLFGLTFDTDPNLPWAQSTLQDSQELPESARVAALQQAAIEFLEEMQAGAG